MRSILLIGMSLLFASYAASQSSPNVLYSLQKRHSFSSSKHDDYFTITVKGKNFSSSDIYFTVVSQKGELLFADRFPMDQFKQFGSTERGGDDSAGVMNRLSHYFDEENFSMPAIRDTLEMENNSIPRDVWMEVLREKGTIGFHYVISTENGREITYSRKQRKVILYYKCC